MELRGIILSSLPKNLFPGSSTDRLRLIFPLVGASGSLASTPSINCQSDSRRLVSELCVAEAQVQLTYFEWPSLGQCNERPTCIHGR